jgi:hypothetical protein
MGMKFENHERLRSFGASIHRGEEIYLYAFGQTSITKVINIRLN